MCASKYTLYVTLALRQLVERLGSYSKARKFDELELERAQYKNSYVIDKSKL